MSLKQLLSLIPLETLKDNASLGGFVLVILLTVVQITPIKWNPWDTILTWLGRKLNAGLRKEVSDLKKEVNAVKGDVEVVNKKLDEHIVESKIRDLKDTRRDILDFCNSCMNGQRHTMEQFRFVIKKCDDYEAYVEANQIKNGEITSAIKEIRRRYDNHIQKNDFLKEGEEL